MINTLNAFHLYPLEHRDLAVDAYHEFIETGVLDHARGELLDGFFHSDVSSIPASLVSSS